jgi:glycosyltransferase involved in cell wall biosynthesis
MNKIAVITPYYKESIEILRRCRESVKAQDIGVDHFFIADGFPNWELSKWDIQHIVLSKNHDDMGNTPRGIGSMLADVEGYDFIAYLDADNWMHPNHLSSLFHLWQETEADVCASFRTMYAVNGIEMKIQDKDELLLKHIDTNCLFLHRSSFSVLNVWLKMPQILKDIGDRVFVAALRNQHFSFAHTKQRTSAYCTRYKIHYSACGLELPGDAKDLVGIESYKWLLTPQGMRETKERLGFCPFV